MTFLDSFFVSKFKVKGMKFKMSILLMYNQNQLLFGKQIFDRFIFYYQFLILFNTKSDEEIYTYYSFQSYSNSCTNIKRVCSIIER